MPLDEESEKILKTIRRPYEDFYFRMHDVSDQSCVKRFISYATSNWVNKDVPSFTIIGTGRIFYHTEFFSNSPFPQKDIELNIVSSYNLLERCDSDFMNGFNESRVGNDKADPSETRKFVKSSFVSDGALIKSDFIEFTPKNDRFSLGNNRILRKCFSIDNLSSSEIGIYFAPCSLEEWVIYQIKRAKNAYRNSRKIGDYLLELNPGSGFSQAHPDDGFDGESLKTGVAFADHVDQRRRLPNISHEILSLFYFSVLGKWVRD